MIHLGCLPARRHLVLCEQLHDGRVEVGHQDLNCLIGLLVHPARQVLVQWVQRVEVPAIPTKHKYLGQVRYQAW